MFTTPTAGAWGAALLGAALLLGVPACGRDSPYLPQSEFWQPLPADPEPDPASAAYISDLVKSLGTQRLAINIEAYGVAVVRPPAGTPRIDVALSQQGDTRALREVPLPSDAQPAPGSDGHLVVIDSERQQAHEFWQLHRTGTSWQASGGVRFDLSADGINHTGGGVRASSLSLLLGLITYDEATGEAPIQHALAFAFDAPNSRFFVPPAASSDGKRRGRTTSIPAGARLQLDPSLDLSTLDLSPASRRVAEAMQRYGLFCVDTTDGATLYAEVLTGVRSWQGVLTEDAVGKLPLSRLRVLRLPTPVPIP